MNTPLLQIKMLHNIPHGGKAKMPHNIPNLFDVLLDAIADILNNPGARLKFYNLI